VGAIDEKHSVRDVVFLAEFSEKRMGEDLRCGRFKLYVE